MRVTISELWVPMAALSLPPRSLARDTTHIGDVTQLLLLSPWLWVGSCSCRFASWFMSCNTLWASAGLELWGFFCLPFDCKTGSVAGRVGAWAGSAPRGLHWKESHFPPWLFLVSVTVSEKKHRVVLWKLCCLTLLLVCYLSK